MRPYIPGVQCTGILDNKMQCIRTATIKRKNDPENKTALCPICFNLKRAMDPGFLAGDYTETVPFVKKEDNIQTNFKDTIQDNNLAPGSVTEQDASQTKQNTIDTE